MKLDLNTEECSALLEVTEERYNTYKEAASRGSEDPHLDKYYREKFQLYSELRLKLEEGVRH